MKRIFDLVIASSLFVVLLPVLCGLGLLVRLFLGTPILFCQTRSGLGGKPFRIYKFRTMTNAHNAAGELLEDRARQTAFGQWLRSTSLDELPELLNVLRGDMSLVGPRPLLPEYLPRYSAEQSRRHDVRPGITGWAQVNGRNALDWQKRLAQDVWYVDHQSIALDFKILIKTLGAVLGRRGIAAAGEFSCRPFMGNSDRDPSA